MRQSLGCVLLLLVTSLVSAENWPGWRGPRGDGTSIETGLPTTWSKTENVRWKCKLPGPGNSSPVIWGDRIFLTQSLDKAGTERAVMCIERKSGTVLWKQSIPFKGKEPTHATNPYCAGSPATDGERVIADHGSAGVVCYDNEGKQLWHRDLGKVIHIWGNSSTPVLYGDLVLLNRGPGENSFLIALDKKTGQDVWKVSEPGGNSGEAKGSKWIGSWSTPRILKIDGQDQVVFCWPGAVKAYDPKTGDLIWTCKGLTDLVYTTLLANSEVVVAMSGFHGAALGVKLGGKGDVTATNRLWHHTAKNPQRVGSGVIVGDHVYMANAGPGAGILQCFDLKTGKSLWGNGQRLGADHWGSIVVIEDKLYATDQDGDTFIVEAKPEFKLLGKNSIGERTNASLAISDGDIFIRTFENLWCISSKK
jgi:outer membrane protein assembly factor BamB